MHKFPLHVFVFLSCFGTHAAPALGDPALLPTIHVENFQPAAKTSTGFGPLHAITSGLHTHRVDENAAALSHAVVAALLKAHIAAQALSPSEPLPRSGWLMRGVFYSLDESGHPLTIPFLSKKTPNVEVTVTLADSAINPDTPFAVIGTESVLKGQGAPLGWNPYVVSARLVVHRFEGDKSLNELADQLAQKIADRSADLLTRDAHQP